MARALFLSGFFLSGCLIGKADHASRVEALDVLAPGQSRPEVSEVALRFKFDPRLVFDGLSLLIQVTDEDADLDGGAFIVDGESVPFGEGRPFVGDRYLFDLEVPVGDPCGGTAPSIVMAVADEAGNASEERTVELSWTGAPHGEPSEPLDLAEPYFSITTATLPAVVCGDKRSLGPVPDSYDDVLLFAGMLAMETTANYPTPEGDLRHSYFFDPTGGTATQVADLDPDDGGERLLFTAPAEEPMLLSIDADAQSVNGDWRMFVQTQLGAPL